MPRNALLATVSFATCCVLIASTAARGINPYPRAVLEEPLLFEWRLEESAGWRPLHQCELHFEAGRLIIQSKGHDPYLLLPDPSGDASGALVMKLRARAGAGAGGQVFWTTDEDPHWRETQSTRFPMRCDGEFHDYEVPLPVQGRPRHLRLDPGTAEGIVEIERVALYQRVPHPLEITELHAIPAGPVRVTVANHDDVPRSCSVHFTDGRTSFRQSTEIASGEDFTAEWATATGSARRIVARVDCEGLLPLERTLYVVGEHAPPSDDPEVPHALMSNCLWLARDGRTIATIYPLVCDIDRRIPDLVKLDSPPGTLRLAGEGVDLTLTFAEDLIHYRLQADRPMVGPTVRVLGALEQGLLAGVEYLGQGETSSSTLDIEGPEHLRFRPNPLHITMPLAAYVTPEASVALSWDDMALQPLFATPNFFDGAPDHLMALEGATIEAVIRIGPGFGGAGEGSPGALEEAILWAVRRRDLPPPPEAPRSPEAQDALSLAALEGPIRNENGWCHAIVPGQPERFPFNYHADCASVVWRLSGRVAETPRLVPGGGHLSDESSYFITGRAGAWLDYVDRRAASVRGSQQPDGSFRYSGKYGRGHFEDTASGFCGQSAWVLMRHAVQTGDARSLAAGLDALAFIRRFRTPRGAQVWEVPLHTPDIMASAWCCDANVMAYELTGEAVYLEEARRWAITGLPFVYQWGREDLPIMPYATIAVYGATDWHAPVWIGLPVQWCGLRYADAMLSLAAHDDTLDWRSLALGILRTGLQMQYPDGPTIGTLPDVFELETQSRLPADINPCALVTLQRRLDGLPFDVLVARRGEHRVISPLPARFESGRIRIEGVQGLQYQVIVNRRVVDVDSQGVDWIDIE